MRTFGRQKRAGKRGFEPTDGFGWDNEACPSDSEKTQVKEVVMGHVADRIWELQKDHLEPGEMHPPILKEKRGGEN